MMTKFLLNTGTLIGLIEQNRCIWDTSDADYKSREMRKTAFEGIAEILISGFDTMTPSMKSEAVKLIQQRWKTARDAYRRDRVKIKLGKPAKNMKKYAFYENLTFLDNVMHWYETETENNMPEKMSENSDSENNQADEDNHFETFPPSWIAKRKCELNEDVDVKHFEALQKSHQDDENGDRAFLDSLLPTLRTFDEYERLQFRAEVLRVMMEIKNVPVHTRREIPENKGQFFPQDNA